MKEYIDKQALMDFCENAKSKTIDNNDIARFPVEPAVDVSKVLAIIDRANGAIGRTNMTTHVVLNNVGSQIKSLLEGEQE